MRWFVNFLISCIFLHSSLNFSLVKLNLVFSHEGLNKIRKCTLRVSVDLSKQLFRALEFVPKTI